MQAQDDLGAPSEFYSDLVSELYDPLAGEPARADQYAPFLDLCGTPALELACGSGHPLIELLERGYDIEGLDSSSDMLELCRSRAAERGLAASLHLGLMQSFRLPRRFRSIFLAAASFTLLTSDNDAANALVSIHEALESGGHALIPIDRVNPDETRRILGKYRETTDASGARLRVAVLSLDMHDDGRSASLRHRYERIPMEGEARSVERTWHRRWWTQEQFRELVFAAGFTDLTFVDPTGAVADPDAALFVALARRR
jgi:SAM-dependent methyltransferase